MSEALLMSNVSKYFTMAGTRFSALRNISLRVGRGELVMLVGRSGSGKTTLMTLAGAIDRPDEGRVVVDGRDLAHLDGKHLYEFRRRTVGWVFQTSGLLPLLTAVENVALTLRIQGMGSAASLRPAISALEALGMADRAQHRAFELSGGEQQRVALARALVKRPLLLLADEPTGQLDVENAREVAALLRAATTDGTSVLLATHDTSLQEVADRVIAIEDGHLMSPA